MLYIGWTELCRNRQASVTFRFIPWQLFNCLWQHSAHTSPQVKSLLQMSHIIVMWVFWGLRMPHVEFMRHSVH